MNFVSENEEGAVTKSILTAGSVVYVGLNSSPMQVLWGEQINTLTSRGDGEEIAEVLSEELVLRVYPSSLVQNSRNRRPSLNVDYKNSETVSAQDINYFQIGGDNQRAGSGLQDHMATRSFRGKAFANCADPQLWLQAFRDQSATGGSGAHKRLFCELNNGAFNNAFVTSRYKASDRNVPCVHDMRAQFKLTAQLYNEHVILNNEVPDGLDTSKLKHINLLPIRLVSKLGFFERLRMSPQRVRVSSSPLRNERQQQQEETNRHCLRQTRGKRRVRNFLV